MRQGSVAKAALMGGVLSGLASAIPCLNVVNLCCCGLVVVGGSFAAWVLHSDAGGGVPRERCAAAGLGAGAIAGSIWLPLSILVNRLTHDAGELERSLAEANEMLKGIGLDPSDDANAAALALQRAFTGLDVGPWTLLPMAMSAVAGAFFGLLGGLIGASLLARRQRPGGIPPPVPPPESAPPPSPDAGPPPAEQLAPEQVGDGLDAPPVSGDLAAEDMPAFPPEAPPSEPRG